MEWYFIALSIIVSYEKEKKKSLLSQTLYLRLKSTLERHFYISLTQYLTRTEIDPRTILT